MPTKEDTNQMHIRPGREMINRLHELAIKCRRESGNMVAVQIIKDCINLWAKAEQAKEDMLRQEEERIDAMINGELLRQPLMKGSADTESATKPLAGTRKRK